MSAAVVYVSVTGRARPGQAQAYHFDRDCRIGGAKPDNRIPTLEVEAKRIRLVCCRFCGGEH